MSRGARAVAQLLAGAPATSVNLDDLDADWRLLAEVLLEAPDRGAALEAALAQRPDGNQRWANGKAEAGHDTPEVECLIEALGTRRGTDRKSKY